MNELPIGVCALSNMDEIAMINSSMTETLELPQADTIRIEDLIEKFAELKKMTLSGEKEELDES